MDTKTIVTAVIASVIVGVFLVVFAGVGTDGRDGINGRDGVGAIPGPDVYNRMYFHNGFQSGGTLFASTSAAADAGVTLLASEIDGDVTYIEWNTGDPTFTLTLMASSSMGFLGGNAGDKRVYDFYSSTSTAAATITFVAGTGVDGQESEGSDLVVNGGELARITFIRKANTDVLFLLEVMQAD